MSKNVCGFCNVYLLNGLPSPIFSSVKQCPLTLPALPSMRTVFNICVLITLCWIETHKMWDLVAEPLQWNIIFECAIITEHTMMEVV